MAAPRTTVTGKGTLSVGYPTRLVTISAITPDGAFAVCIDRHGTEARVPMNIQPAKGILPQPGEQWIITQGVSNTWTFAAIATNDDTKFTNSGVAGEGVLPPDILPPPAVPPDGSIPGSAIVPGSLTGTQIAAASITNLDLATAAASTNIILDPQFTSPELNLVRQQDPGTTCTWTFAEPNVSVAGGAAACTLALMPSTLVPLYVNPGEQYYISVAVTLPGGAPAGISAGIQLALSDGSFLGPLLPVSGITQTVAQLITIPPGVSSAYVRLIITGLPSGVTATFTSPVCYVTVGNTAIQANSIDVNKLQANSVSAAQLQAGAVVAGKIQAQAIDGMTITGATLVATGAAGEVLIYDGTPALGNLIGSWSGAAGTDTPGNSFPAGLSVNQGAISGTAISGSTINGTVIDGSQLIADGTSGEFLVYDGTPGLGNLIGSWSGVAGTDQYGNNYPAGLNVSMGAISGSVFSGLNWLLNQNGLFFYTTSAPVALVQAPASGGNGSYVSAVSPVTINMSGFSSTAPGNTLFMVTAYYTTGYASTGAISAVLHTSHASMSRIIHVPFNDVSGTNAVGWIDVWASYNTPGGDSSVDWKVPLGTGGVSSTLAYYRQFYEFSGLGTSPNIDVFGTAWLWPGTSTSFTMASYSTTVPTELWLGGVAGYYNPSATPPAITGPAGPWINQAQAGGQIDGYASSVDMRCGYQIMAATGSIAYNGTFSAAQNWACYALALAPSTAPGAGSLVASVTAVAGADTQGNTFPVGMMGQILAIQPGSSPVLPEGWHSVTMQNGWAAQSGSYARYRLAAHNRVYLEIRAVAGTLTGGTVIGTVPPGWRPAFSHPIPLMQESGSTQASVLLPRIDVQPGGNIVVFNASAGTVNCSAIGSYPLD